MQCGLTCIAIICRYYGINISLTDLENACGSQIYGVNLHTMNMLARDLGFNSLCVKTNIDKLSEAPLPLILHWNHNHFVVLYKKSKRNNKEYYYISDPAKGKYRLKEKDFLSHWTNENKGIALILGTPQNKREELNGSKINLSKSSIKSNSELSFLTLCKILYKYKKQFLKIIATLFIIAISQLIFPFLTQLIVDNGIHEKNLNIISVILIGELILVLGRTIADYMRRWTTLHISINLSITLLFSFVQKLFRLPMRFLQTRRFGDLKQRFEDHYKVQNFLSSDVVALSFTIITFIVYSIVLLIYDITLFSIMIIFSAIYFIWLSIFLSKRSKLNFEKFEALSKNNSYTYQLLTSLPDIKIHNCSSKRCSEWKKSLDSLFSIESKSLKLTQTQEVGSTLINELENIVLTIISSIFVIRGVISLGQMITIQFIIGQLLIPIDNIMKSVYSWQDMKISLCRINEIYRGLDEKELYNNRPIKYPIHFIKLYNLSFSYEKYSPFKAIDNISITIPKGTITAIVGPSGSGKSTIMKILLGFFPEINSNVFLNNTSLEQLDIEQWRRKCGVVMQNGAIFSDSIEANIVMDKCIVDEIRFKKAIEIACLEEFVKNLPLGYKTRIGRDGKSLSKGQTQRILIARAVYKDPEFIFFDEATNSLDASLEHKIVKNLNKFFKNKTVIIIAHRLSTIKNANKILVLDKGKIIEEGTHEQLLQLKNSYWNLIHHQLTI